MLAMAESSTPDPLLLSEDADTWIERHLYTWARWMRRNRDEGPAGYLRRAPGMIGYTHDGRGDKLYDQVDGFVAEAVDACLLSLPPGEWAAVQAHYGLAVFRFPRGNEADLYASAKARLIPLLRRRNVV